MGIISLILSIIGIILFGVVMVFSATLGRIGMVLLLAALVLSAAALVLGVISLIKGRNQPAHKKKTIIGIVISIIGLAILGYFFWYGISKGYFL